MMNDKVNHKSAVRSILLAVAIVAVVGVAFSSSAAALELNPDNGITGNLTSGAGDQPIGELQFVEDGATVTSTTISFPNGVNINESASAPNADSRNMTSQSVEITGEQKISVSYDTVDTLSTNANGKAYLNITGIRVDVPPSTGASVLDIEAGNTQPLNITGLTVGTNQTVLPVRGQKSVGPQNVSIFPETPVPGNVLGKSDQSYTTRGPNNKSLIGAGTEVKISIPDEEDRVTFDTDASVTLETNQSVFGGDEGVVENNSEATVNEKEISFTTTGNLSQNATIEASGIRYDTTGLTDSTLPANFTTNLTVETEAETPVSTRSQTASQSSAFDAFDEGPLRKSAVAVERPGVALNRTINVTSGVANTTRFNISIEDNTQYGGALGADTQVTAELPSGGGITFNTSDNAPPTFAKFNNTAFIEDRIDSGISVSPYTVTVSMNNSTSPKGALATEPISLNITNLTLDSARGTTNQTINLSVTTTANKSADSIVQNTTIGTTQNGIERNGPTDFTKIDVANGNNVTADINASTSDFSYGDTTSSFTRNTTGELRPGDTVTSAIQVTDRFNGHPSGITVDLNTTENPTDDSILTRDSVVTNSTGEATFDVVLGDQAGTYNVTASLEHNKSSVANVTLEYKAEPGEPDDFRVTGVNNSVTDTSGIGASARPLEQAAYKVQVVDANGNPTNATDIDVNIETSADLEGVTYNLSTAQGSQAGPTLNDTDNDGKRNYNATKFTNGEPVEFFVFVSSSEPGEETVTVSSDGTTDEGTATVYSSTLDSVDVSVDKTDLSEDEEFNVTAVGKIDGTPVEVSGINTDFKIEDNTIAFLQSGSDTTNLSGQATVAGQALTSGDTQVNATIGDTGVNGTTQGSTPLGAEEAADPAQPATFEVDGLQPQEATVNVSEAFDVEATVENTGGQGEQDVELRLEPDGDAVTSQTVSLNSGETTTVTFDGVTVDTAGEYNHTVASANESATGTLTVEGGSGEVPPDAVYEPGDPSAGFDADNSGTIDAGELNSAGTEFALGNLNASELNSVGTDFALS